MQKPSASLMRRTAAARRVGGSALRRRWRRGRRTRAALGHELIELGLVAREAQPLEKLPELALLLFEALQRLSPILVESVVAARWRAAPAAAEALHLAAHAVHLLLHALHLVLPMRAAVARADHAFAP